MLGRSSSRKSVLAAIRVVKRRSKVHSYPQKYLILSPEIIKTPINIIAHADNMTGFLRSGHILKPFCLAKELRDNMLGVVQI